MVILEVQLVRPLTCGDQHSPIIDHVILVAIPMGWPLLLTQFLWYYCQLYKPSNNVNPQSSSPVSVLFKKSWMNAYSGEFISDLV